MDGLASRMNKQLLLGVLVVLTVGLLFTGAALTVGADEAEPTQESVDVSFEHANDLALVPGADQTFEVVVDGPTEGIEAYDLEINLVDNEADAEIVGFSETASDTLNFSNSEYTADSVTLQSALADETFDGADEIVVAEVHVAAPEGLTVEGDEERLDWDVEMSGDISYAEDGQTLYDATYVDSPQELVLLDVNDNGLPAEDRTGNGLLEDIESDGEITLFDALVLLDNRGDALTPEQAEFFNFDGANPDEVTLFDALNLLDLRT